MKICIGRQPSRRTEGCTSEQKNPYGLQQATSKSRTQRVEDDALHSTHLGTVRFAHGGDEVGYSEAGALWRGYIYMRRGWKEREREKNAQSEERKNDKCLLGSHHLHKTTVSTRVFWLFHGWTPSRALFFLFFSFSFSFFPSFDCLQQLLRNICCRVCRQHSLLVCTHVHVARLICFFGGLFSSYNHC